MTSLRQSAGHNIVVFSRLSNVRILTNRARNSLKKTTTPDCFLLVVFFSFLHFYRYVPWRLFSSNPARLHPTVGYSSVPHFSSNPARVQPTVGYSSVPHFSSNLARLQPTVGYSSVPHFSSNPARLQPTVGYSSVPHFSSNPARVQPTVGYSSVPHFKPLTRMQPGNQRNVPWTPLNTQGFLGLARPDVAKPSHWCQFCSRKEITFALQTGK